MVFLMKNKSETLNILMEYVEEAEAKWSLRVAKIRCDKGGEYKSNEMKIWCKSKGLKKEMWGEALRTAAYIINRSPTEATDVTPAEMCNNDDDEDDDDVFDDDDDDVYDEDDDDDDNDENKYNNFEFVFTH
ncbi:nucleophosmin-like [Uloborus diversus]|uniref:nucleophosmin-like n=1 Tax=Uloborus diversus TaxID=327109 RepID=UPI0024095398|nr:nucleophosmin-like [Uloborus diversus]